MSLTLPTALCTIPTSGNPAASKFTYCPQIGTGNWLHDPTQLRSMLASTIFRYCTDTMGPDEQNTTTQARTGRYSWVQKGNEAAILYLST
ncbi:hypothetical protein EX30DRAFT_375659 [Ascodesmis nigricans]|uniref:Uncharacterized protein n=1 Tax=Ascodesmis nigricans TaxID=341454 RepID=A0A4S2MHA0_9PEZI|nr:hypothetical protein EX30DRAFT_375659 [Ascodesmis nigricans]